MSELIPSKSSQSVVVNPISTQPIACHDGVPWKLMEFFAFTPLSLDGDTKMKMDDVWKHFKSDDIDETLLKVAEVERKLGRSGNERQIDKIWRYAKLQNQITNLEKQRAELYEWTKA